VGWKVRIRFLLGEKDCSPQLADWFFGRMQPIQMGTVDHSHPSNAEVVELVQYPVYLHDVLN
jgi:hypothetical protein